ncbi:methyl-CpG-binding domain protein 2 isoform X1 [Scaptodrosophila lebanonensis]|uniref:Methyl-CpG-binding domain protein 2 isoform X1 n=1 Tax=Drosophila lebanonensis TaxID=7225 RepID=A0A6J2TFE8_DROLE|nr:methyl-CpG-binding domain protein 2 isoform X1 [Scaptodrosophila lebanonensis]
MQMNPSVTIERKRVDCAALPKGWQREEVLRKSGISAGSGKVDVYYYSPTGKKIETKPQLARQLGDVIDISNFDFQSGKMLQHHLPSPSISLYRCNASGTIISSTGVGCAPNALKRKFRTQGSNNNNTIATTTASLTSTSPATAATTATASANLRQQLEFSRALRTDVSLVPPIRQTASIFKQPVTVIRNHEPSKVKHDAKHGGQEKPKQLFWEKRLERLRACHDTGEELDDITLPKTIRTVGPNVNEQTVLQSVATALHVLNAGVHGQTSAKADLTKNAMAFMNPEQPLMHAVIISEDDIRKQEDRVSVARRKLQDALKT